MQWAKRLFRSCNKKTILSVCLKTEEEKFLCTLEKGMKLLEGDIAGLSGNVIAGKTIFMLYDTFGFSSGFNK